jgi:nucleoside-diphosphate-sugar epimerase
MDIGSVQLSRVVAGHTGVLHLGAARAAKRGESGGRSVDRNPALAGAQNLFRSAAEAGVLCALHVSSAAVYELPPRQRPIAEEHPRAALRGFAWAENLVALEAWLDTFQAERRGTRVMRLRPHLIVGRGAAAPVRALLRALFSVRFVGRPPQLQCVHVDDVAQAILHALFHKDADGAFNLACANAATLKEMQRFNRRGLLPLPFPLAYRWLRLASRFDPAAEPAWMEMLRHDIVLDTTRARRRLGWKPRYDTIEACMRAME